MVEREADSLAHHTSRDQRGIPDRVLWITTDHLRFDCIAANGNPEIHTPNLDQLVRSGVSFGNCFAQNPVCMPSRASFMTGFYPQQTGVTQNGNCLPPDSLPTVADAFSALGYQTAQIGKLHLQPHDNYDLDARPRHRYGFDSFINSEARGCYDDAWITWLRMKYPEHVQRFLVPRVLDRTDQEDRGSVIDAPWEASHSGWISWTMRNYLETHKDSRQFLHLGFHNPHPPLNPTRSAFEPYEKAKLSCPPFRGDEWEDKPAPLAKMLQNRKTWTEQQFTEYKRYFYALVTEVDLAMGEIIGYLRQNKMLDETLIVFSSDHGDMCGNHRMTHKGPHFFDEVMRVPLVMHWPAGFGNDGRTVEGLTELVDVLPSMQELCDGHVANTMPGRSYAQELLTGGQIQGRDDVFAYHEPGWAMLRTEKYKYLSFSDHGTEVLYDLSEPEMEVKNRAGDDRFGNVLNAMRKRMMERALSAAKSRLTRDFAY